jgi:hypothetical protein
MATARILPAPEPFAVCPQDGKILEFYAGTFEAVFISLHPFLRPTSIDVATFRPGNYPKRSDVAAHCDRILWSEVARLANLASLSAVDVGLRTRIHGLREDLQNDGYASAIDALSGTHGVMAPPEGLFSDLLHKTVLQSIKGLGYEWLWVGDEFCTERTLRWIDDLLDDEKLTRGRYNLFTPDKAFLWTVHWDSHFSFLCSSESNLAAVKHSSDLEGFFCDQSTEVYWSVQR